MPDLEQQLTSLGTALDWPPTPDLVKVIHLPARRGWGGTVGKSYQTRWALAAAAAIVIAAAGLLAFPPSREAIANWVNVHTIFREVPKLATPSPQPP
jgi:hypothetical protein